MFYFFVAQLIVHKLFFYKKNFLKITTTVLKYQNMFPLIYNQSLSTILQSKI